MRECQREWNKKNPEKLREYKRRYRQRHPEKIRQKFINYHKRRKEKRGYYDLLAKQSGLCAICRTPMEKPHHDHSHTTGKWRGLLCFRCNAGLGLFRDSHEILMQAAAYLREYENAT